MVSALRYGSKIARARGLGPTARKSGMVAHRTSTSKGESAAPSHTPLTRVRRQSRRSPRPKDCATKVSMPSSRPVPQMAMGKNIMAPKLPAPAGGGAERTGHDGIDDAHGHPAELGQGERRRQPHHGTKLAPQIRRVKHASGFGVRLVVH